SKSLVPTISFMSRIDDTFNLCGFLFLEDSADLAFVGIQAVVENVREQIAEGIDFKDHSAAKIRRQADIQTGVQGSREDCCRPAAKVLDLLSNFRAGMFEERLGVASAVAEVQIGEGAAAQTDDDMAGLLADNHDT